ncbi:MAG: hypothetical protein U0169_19305 [Polyangiaceae bacterium]
MKDLEELRARLEATSAVDTRGRVRSVTGLALRFTLPGVRVGDLVRVRRRGEPLPCEVVGFDGGEALAMPFGTLAGVGPDDEVEATGGPLRVHASMGLLGRVVDGSVAPRMEGSPHRRRPDRRRCSPARGAPSQPHRQPHAHGACVSSTAS